MTWWSAPALENITDNECVMGISQIIYWKHGYCSLAENTQNSPTFFWPSDLVIDNDDSQNKSTHK